MSLAAEAFAAISDSELLTAATHMPAGGGAATGFSVLLRRGGGDALSMVGSAEPIIQYEAADAPALTQGDTVTIAGIDYRVRDRAAEWCSADGTLIAYRIREA